MQSDRVRYRSTEQLVVISAFAVAVAAVGIATAHHARSTQGAIFQAVATSAVAAVMLVVSWRAALSSTPTGIEIRNPLSTRTIPWSDIRGFRIGRYRLLGAVCVVDLEDGSACHAFAIQVPNRAIGRPDAKARLVVAQLNDELREHRRATV